MLSIQHAMCLALHDEKPDSKLIAATLYPDAIRAYSGPRQYSHFEKSESGKFSYYMEFPSNMHAGKDFVQKQVASCKEDISLVRPCAIGEETDIDAFYAHNDHLRGEMKQGIDYHLHQDMVFDDFIRREIDCSNKYDDKFVFHGQEMNGKDVRRLIGNIEQQGIYVLAHKLYVVKGITANQEWLKNMIKPALDKEYSADLSDKTFSFMNINPEVNQLITDHDWSRLDDGMIPRAEYEKLYNAVEESMSLVDGRYYGRDFSYGKENTMKIVLAPTYELAKEYADHNRVDATVEAEYGDKVIEGETLTLAHHGSRSNNPAPCNDPQAVKLPDNATVLVSHLDLDTLGGLMALQGQKPDDPDFWKAAEYIDVNGPHHIHEFPQEIQDKLNAYYAFENESRQVEGRPDREHIQDVTESVNKYADGIDVVLDDKDYSHNAMIEAGRRWEQEVTRAVEDQLVSENKNVRVFSTNGPFCNGAYYSPSQGKIIPAVVSYNEKFSSITLSFADGGQEFSARDIVQKLWGPEAGGRDGIAGSPRGQEMTMGDLKEISEKVSDMIERGNRPVQGDGGGETHDEMSLEMVLDEDEDEDLDENSDIKLVDDSKRVDDIEYNDDDLDIDDDDLDIDDGDDLEI